MDHLARLQRGVDEWNAWRSDNPSINPFLHRADLRGRCLRDADLRGADLSAANLQRADLRRADLTAADLSHANVSGADLEDAVLTDADLGDAVLGNPEIVRGDFWRVSRYPGDDLEEVVWAPQENARSLRRRGHVEADLSDDEFRSRREWIMGSGPQDYRPANLCRAAMEGASLRRALCDGVSFRNARLGGADLSDARLRRADLTGADLTEAYLAGADLTRAVVSRKALRSARRKRRSWADTLVDDGPVGVYTYDFHDELTRPARRSTGDIHVTLIHGTFARRADWVGAHALLARQLSSEAGHLDQPRDVHVHAHRWSGRNTLRARHDAAVVLREHLARLVEQHPTAMHCAVAHSHGGAVLLQALGDPTIARRMTRVVCVSTPFLRVLPTGDEWRTTFSLGLHGLALVGLLVAAVWLSLLGAEHPLTEGHAVLVALSLEVMLTAAAVAGIKAIGAALRRWRARADVLAVRSAHPQLPLSQALFIRTAADEAGFVLGLGASFAWLVERTAIGVVGTADLLAHLVVRPLGRIRSVRGMDALVLTSCAALLLAVFVVLLPQSSLRPGAYVVLAVAGLIVLPGVLLLFFVLMLAVCYLPFGRDLAMCAPFLRATAEAAPSGIWTIFQFPNLTVLPLSRLQHSFIYEYSSLRLFIARWLISGEFISTRAWREM